MTRNVVSLSFKQQIFMLFAVGILLFSFLSALTTGWLSGKTIGHTLTEQGLQVTTSFARQSVLALLYEDEESIRDAASVVLSFPGVQHLTVYTVSGKVIYSHGAVAHPKPIDVAHLKPFESRLVKETDNAWCFIAAVYDVPSEQGLPNSPFEMRKQQSTQLGYVLLTLEKSGLQAIQRTVFLENISGILLIALIFSILLLHHAGKLIRPLNKLSSLMKNFGVGSHRVRAEEEGAQEVRNMAHAFNSMMATLEDHTDKLEKQKQKLELEISERQQIERHLKDRETHLRTVIENVAEGIVVLNDKEQIESINSAGLTIFHSTHEQMISRELAQFLGGPHCELATDSRGCLLSGIVGMGTIEATGFSDDGQEFPLEISVSDMLIDGHRKFIVMVREITQRKAQELALKNAHDTALDAVRIKSEFLANMSHEIRTPLNGLLGMMELLSGTRLNAEQKEYSDIARSSGDALLNIINEVLDFSKLEAGKIELEKVEFNLIQLLEEVVCLYAPKAQSKGLNLSLLISSSIPTYVQGDPVRVRQILSNLIDNAVKFTDVGEVYLRVTSRMSDASPQKILITLEVNDTGIGIDQQAQEKIFGSFIQADGSATRQFGGTGLGLSIARQLVELMGGTLALTSTPDQGSQFCFTNSFDVATSGTAPQEKHITNYLSENIEVVLDNIDDTNTEILETYLNELKIDYRSTSPDAMNTVVEQGGTTKLIVFIGNHDAYINTERSSSRLFQENFMLGMRTHYLLLVNLNDEPGESKYSTHLSYLQKPILRSKLRKALEKLVPNSLPNKNIISTTQQQPSLEVLGTDVTERHCPKILLAEDNEINQKLTLKMLSKMGYQATVANNGHEVISALGKSKYDLVLMDCQMPEMDGYQATSAIRNTPDHNQDVIIIAVTGNALSHDREKCINAGIDDYLAKPFKYSALSVVIEKWLNTNSAL